MGGVGGGAGMNEYVLCTLMSGPHHCVRTWEEPTGAGGRRMVCVRHDKHYKPCTRPPRWVRRGLHGVRTLCTVPIGPGGWGQRPRSEPA